LLKEAKLRRLQMGTKFPCDSCEKKVCLFFCGKFEEYAKANPHSRKVKMKIDLAEDIKSIGCIWLQADADCGLRFKGACDANGRDCKRLEKVLNIFLKNDFWSKSEEVLAIRAYKCFTHEFMWRGC
jgi:hypothetical protein